MSGAPRLLVHIGMGKTGTSSIQETLKAGRETLLAHGQAYLGLMLEHAGTMLHPWQVATGSPGFFARRDRESLGLELRNVLAAELRALGERGITQAIWSNEWMFGRHAHVVPGLLRLKKDGFDIRIVCWVRRVDAWARSAYIQWGLKEKAERGPVKPFADWARHRDFAVRRGLDPWIAAFGESVLLRNYDAVPDVVDAFLDEFAPGVALPRIRDNDTPGPAVLGAWLLHNTRQPGPVPPAHFQASWRRGGVLAAQPSPRLSDVLPTGADLDALRATHGEDTAAVNRILAAQGQAPLDPLAALRPVSEPDPWEMQALLLRMVGSLNEQVDELRREVHRLKQGKPAG